MPNGSSGMKHNWDQGTITGYNPPANQHPFWLASLSYQKPKLRHTCLTCGQVMNGDADALLLYRLLKEDCPGPKTLPTKD